MKAVEMLRGLLARTTSLHGHKAEAEEEERKRQIHIAVMTRLAECEVEGNEERPTQRGVILIDAILLTWVNLRMGLQANPCEDEDDIIRYRDTLNL